MQSSDHRHHTYIINLEKRKDRKLIIEKEFSTHTAYNITFFNAIVHQNGAIGLFLSFQKIIQLADAQNLDYVIICEDDHIFTAAYNEDLLNNQIKLGQKLGFDILLGGISNVHDALFFNQNLVWVSGFSGLQFTIVFKKFYHTILSYTLVAGDTFDLMLGKLSNHIYCCYPAISSQYAHSYSDATLKNNGMDVGYYFQTCNKKLNRLYKISEYFDILKQDI